ncbi:MAG: hypothetical protein EBY22_05040 [Gammaproteobacteria bacterium]|nr:hypothetical protein [Gammaproteobacteria bacterium]
MDGDDAWDLDPFNACYLSFDALGRRDHAVFAAAKAQGVPVAWNLAGGYADPMQKTIDIHLQTLRLSDSGFYKDKK